MYVLEDNPNRRDPKYKSHCQRLHGIFPWMTERRPGLTQPLREKHTVRVCLGAITRLTIDHVQVDLGLGQCHGGV